jgi:hypothetical protein
MNPRNHAEFDDENRFLLATSSDCCFCWWLHLEPDILKIVTAFWSEVVNSETARDGKWDLVTSARNPLTKLMFRIFFFEIPVRIF